jgi:CSLREA domain-containing protein
VRGLGRGAAARAGRPAGDRRHLHVNTTSDATDGACDATHCSLREALAAAQAGGPHTIAFDIPGSGVRTITVGSGCVPRVFTPVTVDGYTQPGSSPNTNATGAINAVPLDTHPPSPIGSQMR